jgi:hypothetical protein
MSTVEQEPSCEESRLKKTTPSELGLMRQQQVGVQYVACALVRVRTIAVSNNGTMRATLETQEAWQG